MDLIRIRLENLQGATTFAGTMGLVVDRVYGDRDTRYANIGARKAGSRGNHERRWTPSERARVASFVCTAAEFEANAPALTVESRCRDEVEYFARGLTDAELAQYARRTTRRPLLCFALLSAVPFVAELVCRLLGAR